MTNQTRCERLVVVATCFVALAMTLVATSVVQPAGASSPTVKAGRSHLSSMGTGVSVPIVSGPVTGGSPDIPVNAMPADLKKQYNYSEKEFFISGIATAYRPVGVWGVNGRWGVAPSTRAAYKTRIIVRAPINPKKFNGTVIVEWLNETAGRDADPDFGFAYPELLRAGFAYVGVSAQALGVVGTPGFTLPIPGYNPLPLVTQNPTRYAGLVHPGDDYSYDIFSQAAQAILRPDGVRPLGRLRPKYLIATGESQSASRMTTYVNAIAPVADIFNGYLIHSRGATGAPLSAASAATLPKVARIRTDLAQPVMIAETETDLFGLGFYAARQPDTARIRVWEMAGTSHADQSTLDYGIASGRQWDPTASVPSFAACGTINDGPQRFVIRDVFAVLNAWVVKGVPPTRAPRFKIAGSSAIARDASGNAIGGIRTPAVDVPISTLTGSFDPTKSVICSLFGSTAPFSTAELKALYPSHQNYVHKVKISVESAVGKQFLLPPDAKIIVAQANAAHVPS